RCLEKNREERFQSARDLAFHLEQLEQVTSGAHVSLPLSRSGRRVLPVVALGAAAFASVLMWLITRPEPAPAFHQLSFHRGRIGGARFASQAIVYSQALGVGAPEVWIALTDSPEPYPLGYAAADVLAARSGELALSIRRRFTGGERFVGTLAVAPVGGGAPRETLEDVEDADWNPS